MFGKNERLCPLIRRACIKEKCEAWYAGVIEVDTGKGLETRAHSACVEFFWKPLYLKGIGNRVDGTQHAVEGMRNEYAKAGVASYEAIRDVAGQIRWGLEHRHSQLEKERHETST